MAPKVSVIVPNYNHSKYLAKRIRSVLDQTYTDFDVLIMDDFSSDDSRRVIERFIPDDRIRTSFNSFNSGNTFRQWFKGALETESDYVWIAESDDFCDPRFLEVLVPLLEQNPRVGMAVCASVAVDENDVCNERHFDSWTSVGVPRAHLEIMQTDVVMDGRDYCRNFMAPWTSIPNASAVLFRREALTSSVAAGFEMKLGGDSMVYCHVLKAYDIARSSEPLNFFRQHRHNVRSKVKPALFVSESLRIQKHIVDTFGKTTIPDATWRFFTHLMIGHERQGPNNKVPLGRISDLLGEMKAIHNRLFREALPILAREALADLVWRLRGSERAYRSATSRVKTP